MIIISTGTADLAASVAHIPVDEPASAREPGKREDARESAARGSAAQEPAAGEFSKILASMIRQTGATENTEQQNLRHENLEEKNTAGLELVSLNTAATVTAAVQGADNTQEKEIFAVGFSDEESSFFSAANLLITQPNAQSLNDDAKMDTAFLNGEVINFLANSENAKELDLASLPVLSAAFAESRETENSPRVSAENTAAIAKAEQKAEHKELAVKLQNNGELAERNVTNSQELRSTESRSQEQNLSENKAVAAEAGENRRSQELAGLRNGQEGQGEDRNRLEAARERGRHRNRFTVDVQDYRTENASVQKNSEMRFHSGLDTRYHGDGSIREITLELKMPGQAQSTAIADASTSWEAKTGRVFEDLLAKELQNNFNGDIVRHASMALKNDGAAIIKLNLKPETLGNVKINLEMAENKITGRIIVESEEALRAFRREIHSLEQAFRDAGLEVTNLNLSLASGGRGAEQQAGESDVNPFQNGQIAVSRYGTSDDFEQTTITDNALYGQELSSVNVLA